MPTAHPPVYNPTNRKPTEENKKTDRDVLRALLQEAANVELFTIPLYMSALYSIVGFKTTGSMDRWPGLKASVVKSDPWSAENANQTAFNIIFSVYVQEMFHLQLAGNIAAAVGTPLTLDPPSYDCGQTIPCIGNVTKLENPIYHDVQVKLGRLDLNQIKLFMAIESPDWTVSPDYPQPPYASPKAIPTMGSIGHLYDSIEWYLKLQYDDGSKLWHEVYQSDAHQVDVFTATEKPGGDEEYSFPVRLDKLDPDTAQGYALGMAMAIIEQGEGACKDAPGVPQQYQPDPKYMKWQDADVRAKWDSSSHFERFSDIYNNAFIPDAPSSVTTWPDFKTQRGAAKPWKPDDFLQVPAKATPDEKAQAVARCGAYNDSKTAGEVNGVLNQSYNRVLATIADCWSSGAAFPFAAMQALSSRVVPVWAAQGDVEPTFAKVSPPDIDKAQAHSCQGLNACKGQDVNHDPEKGPGEGSCALAVQHTCGSTNDCKHQGGCGYTSVPKQGSPTPTSPPNFVPAENDCKQLGGCGAPIPVAQVFHNPAKPTQPTVYEQGTQTAVEGSVWDRARLLFDQNVVPELVTEGKITEAEAKHLTDKANWPAPNNLRLVLPPS